VYSATNVCRPGPDAGAAKEFASDGITVNALLPRRRRHRHVGRDRPADGRDHGSRKSARTTRISSAASRSAGADAGGRCGVRLVPGRPIPTT
jgi:hypothetical protein